MPLKSEDDGIDSANSGGGTCVLVLSEKPHSVNQYKSKPSNIQVSPNKITKVVVSTETNEKFKRENDRKLKDADPVDILEGVAIFAPLLTSAPKDFNYCPPAGIFQGYVHTLKALKRLLEQYESQTSSRFILYARSSAFGDGDWMKGKHRVTWEIAPNSRDGISLPFQGIPFFIVGHAIYDCQNGRRRKPVKRKKKDIALPENTKKKDVQQLSSIKIGCPAQILMREVIMFPEFKLTTDTLKRRQQMSQKVRNAIQLHVQGKDMLQTERRIYIYFPRPTEHYHRLNKGNSSGAITRTLEPVDPRIEKKIQSLVSQGMTGTKKIREHVNDFVKEILPEDSPPPSNRRRYNPSDQDIRNTMKKARAKIRKARRKSIELQCSLLMHGIREHLATIKSEKYLTQLKDHLNNLNALVRNEESLEHLLLCSQGIDDAEQPSSKKIKENSFKQEVLDEIKIIETPTHALCPEEFNSTETVHPQQTDKPLVLKAEQLGSLIEIPAITGPPTYIYSNSYESGESSQMIYQEDAQNHSGQVEGVTQIYYYQKLPNQPDIYTMQNQDCSQVPYNITELIKDQLD